MSPSVGPLGTGAGREQRVNDEELARIAKFFGVGPDGVFIADASEMFRSDEQKYEGVFSEDKKR